MDNGNKNKFVKNNSIFTNVSLGFSWFLSVSLGVKENKDVHDFWMHNLILSL